MAKSRRDLVDERACVLMSQIHSDILDIMALPAADKQAALEQLRMKARDALSFMLTEMEILKGGRDGKARSNRR